MGLDLSVLSVRQIDIYTIILTAVYFLASMRTVRGRGAGGGGGGGAVEWTCEAPRPSQHPRSGPVSAGVGTDDNV